MFITIEGCDGVGKSTQAKLLDEAIDSHGADVLLTHEPGGTPFGMRIREIIKSEPDISLKSQFHLIEAQRTHHVNHVIKPAKERGWTIICDRFIDTSYVYQHDYLTEDEWKNYIENYEIIPDLTFFLFTKNFKNIKQRMLDRSGSEMDHFDNESIDKLIYKQSLFHHLAALYPNRIKSIDADKPKIEVFNELWSLLNGTKIR